VEDFSSLFRFSKQTCHDLGAAAGLRFSTSAEYESYISMKRPKGVRISDEELPILADYLFQRFGKRQNGT
jgi:hypothetical protein